MRKRELKQIIATLRAENEELKDAAKRGAYRVESGARLTLVCQYIGMVFVEGGELALESGTVRTLNIMDGAFVGQLADDPLGLDDSFGDETP